MAEFELKITGSMAELFAIASRLGGAKASPGVIATNPGDEGFPTRRKEDDVETLSVGTKTDTPVAALETASAAPRKRRTKAEIAADEAAAKPSAFETPVEEVEPMTVVPDEQVKAEEVAETTPLETSPPTSGASPAAGSVPADSVTWQDCHDMMDLIVNKQKPPAAPLKVLEALKGATNGEITNLSALKERPDMLAAAYTALAQFKA